MALKELVEVLCGQRGEKEDYAVTFADVEGLVPSNDTDWTPLPFINGWVNYGSPFSPCGFRKLSTGLVLVRGLAMNGTAAGIGQLPAGYRPGIQMLYASYTTPNTPCRIDVAPDGTLSHYGGAAGWISLCNIVFLAEN